MSTEILKKHQQEVAAIVDQIPDGSSIALAPDYSGCAMAVIRGLIRAQRRDLHLIGVPQMGFQADMLVGAGAVKSMETAAVTLGEYGQAPRFCEAVEGGDLTLKDATCPVIHAGLQAAEKGIPFMPLRGVIGSDLSAHRNDWIEINNPFAQKHEQSGAVAADPILLFPAIKPDVALFHAPLADSTGNVWIGIRRELMLMAHAATKTFVTAEQITTDSLLNDDRDAAGTIPSLYVSDIVEVKKGAWPVGLFGCYDEDQQHLSEYVNAASSAAGFNEYRRKWIDGQGSESAAS